MLLLITEVHNFGGFFGGDTVTLSGVAWPRAAAAAEQTLTIDEAALANVAGRHNVAAGMLLALELAGERVEQARLLAAADQPALRTALGAPTCAAPLDAPQILSYHCTACGFWVAGEPHTADGHSYCTVCNAELWE